MKKTALIIALTVITPCLALAQKKELSQARSYIKSGKDYDKAEKLMTDLLATNEASRTNTRVYLTWYEAVRGQYDAANQKLYLRQKQDTAAFFSLARRMFTILETLDSLEMGSGGKGKAMPEHRQKHASMLHSLRSNLFNGGIYHIWKSEWQSAFDFMEQYIDCARQPLFSSYSYEGNDTMMSQAAYWATFAAFKMNDAVLTLRHHKLALSDTAKAQYTLMYVAEARKRLSDDELYLKTLEEGFDRFPTFHYFFPRLIDFHNQRGQYQQALAVAERAVEECDTCTLYLFAKSTTLLQLERYNECIDASDRIIRLNDSLPEPYFNAGSAWLNKALLLSPQSDKKQLRTCYQQARSYMERYRELAPSRKDKWGPALYRIYLNLNLGRQFDEIDRLLKQQH